eukprot:g1337.t1
MAVWTSLAIHVDEEGYDMSTLGWVVAGAYCCRLPLAHLLNAYGLIMGPIMLVIYCLCTTYGVIYHDTYLGVLFTIYSVIVFVQTPVHQLVIKQIAKDDEQSASHMLATWEGTYSVSYCAGAFIGGLIYDSGPFGSGEWLNVAVFNLVLSYLFLLLSLTLSPIRDSIWRFVKCRNECVNSDDTETDCSRRVDSSTAEAEYSTEDTSITSKCSLSKSKAGDPATYGGDIEKAETTRRCERTDWYWAAIVIHAVFANNAMIAVNWNVFALYMHDEFGLKATYSGVIVAVGDMMAGLFLIALPLASSETKRSSTIAKKALSIITSLQRKRQYMICLLVTGSLATFVMCAPNIFVAICGIVIASGSYVVCQFVFANEWVKIADSLDTYNTLIVRSWHSYNLGCMAAAFTGFLLYGVNRRLPFLIHSGWTLVAASLVILVCFRRKRDGARMQSAASVSDNSARASGGAISKTSTRSALGA